ncbi:ABC transporter substrate-binding protein [Luteithermobacter gelatinilyticus]|uniref:ABC transporter substrate-binding protein n=1 Tax=Luteithermobacter gelatinilyticus TaxID=2582913 RepID=UPI001105E110|nr:ABC transporter substrate-binding protein [Luteithermobacter gelatinilyticus]
MKKTAFLIRRLICRMAVVFLGGLGCGAQAEDSLPKVISLDYCADQYVLALAERSQILALSMDATARHSFYRERALGLPQVRATAEAILSRAPDQVVRYWSGWDMLDFLRKKNIRVTSAIYGSDQETLIRNIREVGQALNQADRAENKIKELKARFDRLKNLPRRNLRALYLTPSGVTAGKNTFVNDLIKLAGFDTLADELDLSGWRTLPLEMLVKHPPDIIIASFFDLDSNRPSNWSISRHRVIGRMVDQIPTIFVPGRYLSCNGIFVAEAADYITREANRLVRSDVHAVEK